MVKTAAKNYPRSQDICVQSLPVVHRRVFFCETEMPKLILLLFCIQKYVRIMILGDPDFFDQFSDDFSKISAKIAKISQKKVKKIGVILYHLSNSYLNAKNQ